jgi:hypothetical protein
VAFFHSYLAVIGNEKVGRFFAFDHYIHKFCADTLDLVSLHSAQTSLSFTTLKAISERRNVRRHSEQVHFCERIISVFK